MITPFIGARLHCWPFGWMVQVTGVEDGDPCVGIVVNVQIITPTGIGAVWQQVQLVQPEDEYPVVEDSMYATWIPGAN